MTPIGRNLDCATTDCQAHQHLTMVDKFPFVRTASVLLSGCQRGFGLGM
ncbi:BQ5605_C003g01972 [Microbotryum silenes-dioicae]|uniref:BQ5605_C003g01972 protein n=1 Tax=Microbotryum silenes-dioicae TaxID=796604 RepID=A0A2X0M4K7_9BASI|nr:BQ5605_C003g01972 [Microbotryum silenes-dioicae]